MIYITFSIDLDKLNPESIRMIQTLMESRFDTLYSQLQEMTNEQSKFNHQINDQVKMINGNINDEIGQIKNQNEGVLREVIRTVERNVNETNTTSVSPVFNRKRRIYSPVKNLKARKADKRYENFSFDEHRSLSGSSSHTRNRNALQSVKVKHKPRVFSPESSLLSNLKRPETTKFENLKRFHFFQN